ncbi:hypothetical protein [Streptomyces sp. XY431]|uniref:hypothetical protein n=1 Tax=Streptomyces sp. XY431 TaxID=1415562 RepID=UPI00133147B2|nr:hypothetical protein [Streptomyces sp. XY431]
MPESGGAFAVIDRALFDPTGGARRILTVSSGPHAPVQLSPAECREALYGKQHNEALRAAIWRQAAAEAQQEPRGGDGTGRSLLLWLTLPGLYRSLHRILRAFGVERGDLEAEAVLAVLSALDETDPEHPETGGLLIRAGVGGMWAYAGRVAHEIPVVDVARFANARNATARPDGPPQPADAWELHIAPPPQRDGLAATLRFTTSRTRREGERLGALAYCAGLPELVFRARRHEEEKLIGTLALRPAGARR